MEYSSHDSTIQSNAAAGAAGSVVNNAGIIRKSAGSGQSDLRMTVHNTGTLGGSGTLKSMLWSNSPMADSGTTVIGPDATLTIRRAP